MFKKNPDVSVQVTEITIDRITIVVRSKDKYWGKYNSPPGFSHIPLGAAPAAQKVYTRNLGQQSVSQVLTDIRNWLHKESILGLSDLQSDTVVGTVIDVFFGRAEVRAPKKSA